MKKYPSFDTSFMWGKPGRYQVPQPQQFNDTMTQLQKMNTLDSHMHYLDRKMYETIMHVDTVASVTENNIEDIEQSVDEFKQETTNQIETFEDNMREFYMPASVETILTEWTNEGKFQDIIEGSVFESFTNELSVTKGNKIFVEEFPRLIGETDDTARIQRAINAAGSYGTIEFETNKEYFIPTPILPIDFQTFIGYGTTLKGDGTNIGIHLLPNGKSCSSNNFTGFTLMNFDIAIKLDNTLTPRFGCYYNNFTDLRILFNRLGMQLNRDANINNIENCTFQSNSETHINIEAGSRKTNIVKCSIEGTSDSVGIYNAGTATSVDNVYFENLSYAVNGSSNNHITIINPFLAPDIANAIPATWYTTIVGNEPNSVPFVQLGDVKIKQTGYELLIEQVGANKTAFKIPIPTQFTSGKIESIGANAEITINDTSTTGQFFKWRSAANVMRLVSEAQDQILHVNQHGNLTAFKGVNGGTFATSNRPTVATGVTIGSMIYDSTLGIPIWFDGVNWKNAIGEIV